MSEYDKAKAGAQISIVLRTLRNIPNEALEEGARLPGSKGEISKKLKDLVTYMEAHPDGT